MGHPALVLAVSCRDSAAAHTAVSRSERLENAEYRIRQRMENVEVARMTKPMWAAVERRICCL